MFLSATWHRQGSTASREISQSAGFRDTSLIIAVWGSVRFKHCKQEKVHFFGIFFLKPAIQGEKNLNICPGHPKRIFTQAPRGREEIFLSSESFLNFFCFGPAKILLWRLNSAVAAAAALDYDTCKLCLSEESGLMSPLLSYMEICVEPHMDTAAAFPR